jgi:hypothetical protein
MSAFRVLGNCYLALLLVFALALVSADRARLDEALSATYRAVSLDLDHAVIMPALRTAFAVDEKLLDSPSHSPN